MRTIPTATNLFINVKKPLRIFCRFCCIWCLRSDTICTQRTSLLFIRIYAYRLLPLWRARLSSPASSFSVLPDRNVNKQGKKSRRYEIWDLFVCITLLLRRIRRESFSNMFYSGTASLCPHGFPVEKRMVGLVWRATGGLCTLEAARATQRK